MRERKSLLRFVTLALLMFGMITGMLVVGGHAQAGPAQQGTVEPTEPAEATPEAVEPTPSGPPIKAGDVFGGGTLIKIRESDLQGAIDFRIFCTGSDRSGPGEVKANCDVLPLNLMLLGPTLFDPSAATLSAVWDQIDWQLSLDGRPVDLDSFGYIERQDERTSTQGDTIPVTERIWAIALSNLTPGKHVFRQVYDVKKDISTSTGAIPAGQYIVVYELNVGAENYALPCRQFTPGSSPEAAPTAPANPPARPGYIGLQFRYESCGGRISVILPDGAAAQTRLRVDDLIVAVDGIKFIDNPDYVFVYRRLNAGDEIVVTVERNGRFLEIPVTLAAPPRSFPTATPRP